MFTNLGRREIGIGTADADLNATWESITRVSSKSKKPLDTKLLDDSGVFHKEGLVGSDESLKIDIIPRRGLVQTSVA
jgi:hypothetical protein